jgi:TolB-like protein/lipoprotein NlpI
VFRVGAAYVVAAWLLIQVAETIFPLFGFDDTPARIVVIGLAIGFFPALLLAWVFEWTPDGLRREGEKKQLDPQLSRQSARRLDRWIMAGLVLALTYFAFDKFVLEPKRQASEQQAQEERMTAATELARAEGRTEALLESYGDHSIAVLPFVNMSSDEEQEYFSDGVTEEVLNLLSRMPQLRVISRTSSFALKGLNLETPAIARRLRVAHILEGSVRRSGGMVRITAQLIEGHSDTHLWSHTWDRELKDIFAVQDEIAEAVANRLEVTLLGGRVENRVVDPAAYELLLASRHTRRSGTPEGWHHSNELADRALEIQPNLAQAWTIKSANFSNMAESGVLPRIESYEKAREAAEKALEINPELAESHAKYAWVAMHYDNDLVLAARHFERALELDPANMAVLSNASALLLQLRRFDEAVEVQEFLSRRDPLNAIGFFNLGEAYFAAGKFEESAQAFSTMLELSPEFRGGQLWLGKALLMSGDAESAYEASLQESFEPFRKLGIALSAHGFGKQKEADEALNWMMEKGARHFPYDIASVWAYRKNGEKTAEWVQKAISYNDNHVGDPVQDPLFAFALQDEGWINLMKALGKTPAQLDSIEFEVKLPEP